ncbi:MAG: hypothetical protein HWN68_04485 [Desulfobacterales bacterium]|nr:hypothetical protein [Desulfobacterales bacterium]
MTQYLSTAADLKDKRLRDFLDAAGSHLHASKEKQILVDEIRKTRMEIEYIENRVDIVREQLQKTTESASETEILLQAAEKELSRIRKERRIAGSEYETLKAIEKDVESKRAVLPDIKRQIRRLRGDVSKLSARFNKLQSADRVSLAEKESLEKKVGVLKTKSSGLETELPVIKNTRDILVGLMPDGFDLDTFDEIQDRGDVEKAINDYVTEVKDQIDKLEKEASGLNTQIEEKHAQEKPLLSKKEDLEGKVEDLTAQVGGEVEKAPIVDEVNGLQAEKERLAAESEQMMKETNQLNLSIKNLDDELKQGTKFKQDLIERYVYLTSRKEEIEALDDIEAEIERIHNEIQKHDRNSSVDDKLVEIINDIKQDIGLINGKLRSAVKEYNEQFDAFMSAVSVWSSNL